MERQTGPDRRHCDWHRGQRQHTIEIISQTASGGPLQAGSFLLGDVDLIDLAGKGNIKKFKKNIIVNLEGKSFETLPEALGYRKNSAPSRSGSLYVFSSVLTLVDHEDSPGDSKE